MRRLAVAVVLSLLAFACEQSDPPAPEDPPDPSEELAPAPDAGAADADRLEYMSPCETDEECESGLCYEFNAKGPHCTRPCELDLECEAPSTGCNGKGVCKAPGDDDGDGGGGGGG